MDSLIRNIFKTGISAWVLCVILLTSLAVPALSEEINQLDVATVKNVSFSHQGKSDLIEISADRPLVYSYYRLNGPLRAVVDLAQTDPGTFTAPLTFKSTNVTEARLHRYELTSGLLTRIEMVMAPGSDFSVKVAAGDKRKLIISFTGPSTPMTTAATSVEPAPKANMEPPAALAPAVPQKKQEQAPVKTTDTSSAVGSGSAKKLLGIIVVPEGIDMQTDAPVTSFNTFTLTKPERLVVDVPGVLNLITKNKLTIGTFGIDTARLGEHEGKSRIVFESSNGSLQKYTVARIDKGLRLVPPRQEIASTMVKSSESKGGTALPTSPEKPVEKPAAAKEPVKKAQVDAVDFSLTETGSRVTVTVSGGCTAEKPYRNSEGLTFYVKNCPLPRTLQRTIDTSAFPTIVESVVPYQVTVKGAPETRVLVKLEPGAEFKFGQDGGSIVLDILHAKLDKKFDAPAKVQSGKPSGDAAPSTSVATPAAVTVTAPPAVVVDSAAKKLQDTAAAGLGDKKIYTGRKVTLEFVDADIRKIFQLIAEVSNLNILIGDDVTGTITIKLINVPWDQALDVILETKGLGMKVDGNIVQIKPKSKFKTADEELLDARRSKDKLMELKTKIFDVNFAEIEQIKTQFDSLKSERVDARITTDKRTNKIIVTDIEPALNRMKVLLESIDIPEKQVMIEARIVEASDTFTRDLGVQWGVHYRDASGSFLGIQALDTGFGGVVTPPPSSGTFGPGMATGITFGTLGSNVSVDLRISAAVTAGQVKIISTPKIATLNHKAAKIMQGQSIPYQNTTANTGAVTQFVEAALTLEVTPNVTPDGSVIMQIKASNNSPGTGTPPPINKKEATTELIVKSGETTVIGGIYIDNDTENNQGVPFLMDIPLIGWMFKSNTKSKTKTELLIFITPRILS